MATKKITKREMFEQILLNYDLTEDEQAFINHEIELLKNKTGKGSKPTATQILNQALKQDIVDFLNNSDEKFTITELIKNVPSLVGLTNQKISNLATQLKNEGLIQRQQEGRKAYFSRIED